ncbi:MAG: hypothetical protein P1V81_03795 [Planctomycetota bacterium]|nr:hypothetical protein [Planctomycetota bacterium]
MSADEDQQEPRPRARSRELLPALGLVLLLVGLRMLLACSGAHTFERGEEFVRAAAATAVLGDLDLPWVDLFYHHYEGGGFVHALLTAGAMQLFGPSLLAHKVVAIGLEVLLLLAGLLLVREAFGRRAQLPFGLLLILAPVAFQKLALLNLGIHYQALLFQFLLAWAGLRLLRGDRSKALLCGLIGGFGLFYNYQLAPLIGLIGLGLLLGRSLDLMGWGKLVVGFLVGALPLLLVWASVGDSVLNIHGQELGEGAKSAATVGSVLRALGEHLGPRGWLQLLLFAALPFAIWSRVPAARRGAYRGLVTYLVLFTLVIPFTGFLSDGFHDFFGAMRYAPLYGFALVLSAGSIALLLEAGGGAAKLGLTACAALLLAGISSTAAALEEGQAPSFGAGYERIATLGGRDLADYFAKVAGRLDLSDRERVELLSSTTGVPRHELLPAVAEAVYRHSKRPFWELVKELREVDPGGWHDYLPGFGIWASRGQGGQLVNCIRRIKRNVEIAAEAGFVEDQRRVRRLMQEGLGRVGIGSFPTEANLRDELDQMAAGNLPMPVYLGFGQRCLRAYLVAPARLDDLLEGRPTKVQEWVRAGFEEAESRRRVD